MPTKDRASLVRRAALSVLGQTHRDIELLVVDDGSTDETPSILTKLAAEDRRVRIFRNEVSRGAPFSRNLAISAATGNWITGIDDDDLFAPTRVEALLSYWTLLEVAGVDFACLYTQDLYDDGQSVSRSAKRGDVSWLDLFEYNTVGNQIFTLTERIRNCGMFDLSMPAWQDLDLFIRIMKRYGPAKLLDAPLYTVSIEDRPDRISRSNKQRIINAYDCLSQKYPEIAGGSRQKLFLQVFGRLYGHRPSLWDLKTFLSNGWDFQNARRFLGLTLRRS
jgi:glycosyltransferase involved in cell wall biosynthesis